MKLKQSADFLVVQKMKNMHHETTVIKKIWNNKNVINLN